MGKAKRKARKEAKRSKFKAKDLERHKWKTKAADEKKKRIDKYQNLPF